MMHIESSIKTTDKPLPGAIGRVHLIDGVARFNDAFDGAEIIVTKTLNTSNIKIVLAQAHEHGHVGTFIDIEPDNRKAAAIGSDRFDMEVEAWLRAFEHIPLSLLQQNASFEFVLDCLNSYRRNSGVEDERWNEAVALIATYAPHYEELINYTPLEPDPGDEPPACAKDAQGKAIGRDGDGNDYNPEAMEDPFGHDDGGGGDPRWLRQDIVDAIRNGARIEDIAAENSLPLDKLPALIQAMR